MKFFKEKRLPRRVLEAKKITDLLNHSEKYTIIWLTFLSTGLRLPKLVNLTWDDVDLDKEIMPVIGSKTETSVRVIHVPRDLIVELKKMSKNREGYVFKTKLGTQ